MNTHSKRPYVLGIIGVIALVVIIICAYQLGANTRTVAPTSPATATASTTSLGVADTKPSDVVDTKPAPSMGTSTAPDCFATYDSLKQLPSVGATADWKTYSTQGYSFKYPADQVKVTPTQYVSSPSTVVNITALDGSASATVRVTQLTQSNFVTGGDGASMVTYEPFSNTWWTFPVLGLNAQNVKPCYPNAVGATISGNPTYLVVGKGAIILHSLFHVASSTQSGQRSWMPFVLTTIITDPTNAQTRAAWDSLIERIIQTAQASTYGVG